MHIVNVHEAKIQFSRLLEEVEQGQEVVISRSGQPVARLSQYRTTRRTISPPGGMSGQIWMAEDFDAPVDSMFECLNR